MNDSTNFYLVIGTFLLAIITFLGIILSNRSTKISNEQTKESNRLHMLELRERFKPFIDVNPPLVISTVSEGYEFNPMIQNIGNIPVYDLTVNYVVLHQRYPIEEIILNEDHIKKNQVKDEGALFPNLLFSSVHIPIMKEDFEQPILNIVLWMEFEYWENLKEEQIFAVNFSHGKNTGFGNYTGRDIEKARKIMKEKQKFI